MRLCEVSAVVLDELIHISRCAGRRAQSTSASATYEADPLPLRQTEAPSRGRMADSDDAADSTIVITLSATPERLGAGRGFASFQRQWTYAHGNGRHRPFCGGAASVSHNCVGGSFSQPGCRKRWRSTEACQADHAGADRARSGQCRLVARTLGWHNRVGLVFQAKGRAAGGAGGVTSSQTDHAGADRARSGQWRLAARAFVSHTNVGGVLEAQGSFRKRWRSTRLAKRIMQELNRARSG